MQALSQRPQSMQASASRRMLRKLTLREEPEQGAGGAEVLAEEAVVDERPHEGDDEDGETDAEGGQQFRGGQVRPGHPGVVGAHHELGGLPGPHGEEDENAVLEVAGDAVDGPRDGEAPPEQPAAGGAEDPLQRAERAEHAAERAPVDDGHRRACPRAGSPRSPRSAAGTRHRPAVSTVSRGRRRGRGSPRPPSVRRRDDLTVGGDDGGHGDKHHPEHDPARPARSSSGPPCPLACPSSGPSRCVGPRVRVPPRRVATRAPVYRRLVNRF